MDRKRTSTFLLPLLFLGQRKGWQCQQFCGQGAQTVTGAIVFAGCVHFSLCITLITHGVTFFAHNVTLDQIFVGPTHDVKIELQDVI